MKTTKKIDPRINDLENKLKRVLADYDNLYKRIEKEKSGFIKFANAELLKKLLIVSDHLELAAKHVKDSGLDLAIKEFQKILGEAGVEEVDCLNKEFNAETMDCIEMMKGKENKVAEIVNKGYKIYDQVLRPAKVKVGSAKPN